MNTALAVNLGNGSTNAFPAMQQITLNRIRESKTNPRRQFDEAKLAELAGNIRLHGVLQPVFVRPVPDGPPGEYELVAGARRYRASKLAGCESIPATVRELTDTECLELQLIENLQRADVHELDEARGYAALMQLQPDTYTVETLAEKVGRSEKYVYARLRLLHLVDEVQQAFYMGKLTVAHAFEVARLQPNDQRRALAECFPQYKTTMAVLKDTKAEAVTVHYLREWIEREIHLDISNAPFDAQDEQLLPSAGSCAACPKRTGNNPLLFPSATKIDLHRPLLLPGEGRSSRADSHETARRIRREATTCLTGSRVANQEAAAGCSLRRPVSPYCEEGGVPANETSRCYGWAGSRNHSSCVPR
jgi:ParB family chromosome partitioning protein